MEGYYGKRIPSLQAALLLIAVLFSCRIGCFMEEVDSNGFHELEKMLPNGSTAQSENLSDVPSSNLEPDLTRRIFTDVNMGGHRLVEIFEDKNTSEVTNCNILADKILIDELLPSIQKDFVKDVTTREMDKFVDKCLDQPTRTEGSLLDFLKEAFHSLVIVPGTKWCGPGDIAKEYDDLGKARGTDMCCRDHDHSIDNIPAFGKNHGLTNFLFYTMTNCADDHNFFNCLLNDSSPLSVVVGIGYFDILKTKCFEFGYPKKCTIFNPLRALFLQSPCEEHEVDTSRKEEWHFDGSPSFLDAFLQSEKEKILDNAKQSGTNVENSENASCQTYYQ